MVKMYNLNSILYIVKKNERRIQMSIIAIKKVDIT